MTEPLSPGDAIQLGGQPFPSEAGQPKPPQINLTPGVYRKGEAGFIAPGSPEHSIVISPSKVAAILGVGRWESPYRLWHRMKGLTPPEPDKDDFRVGHAFESTLAYLWKHDPKVDNAKWQLSPDEVQFVGDAERFGFPYVVTLDRRARSGSSRRILEFKTCRGFEDWGDDFTDEAPPDYVLQVQAQMLLTGFTTHPAHLVVMNKLGCQHHIYEIPFKESIADVIVEECRLFYASLSADTAPPLDDSVATYECVREQHPEIDKGIEAEIPVELALEYHEAWAADDEATKRLRFAKTQILDAIGRANFAVAAGERVARRQSAARGAISLNRIKPGSKAALAGTQPAQDEGAVA
ncbi:YqaJ viral recombinase family protein [Streptomyces massasporeus]|uniref:YqaJ viral recombinase family protein n=1 Tax=Streptomyces massasporeus TaxID=67324 RepID=UPI0036607979